MCYQCLSPLKLSSIPAHGEVYPMQHYAIQFVSDFFPGTPVSTNKTDRHDIAEVLLKVGLNTINQP
jgi:hypothetical protein